MNELVNCCIECCTDSTVVKYEFCIENTEARRLSSSYFSASQSELPLIIHCNNGALIVISGKLLRLSALCLDGGFVSE